jgi:ribosome-binding factor A
MEFDRHDRARSLLTELVAKFIREEANTNPLITVTNLEISPNYQHVTVLFTTIPDAGADDALVFLKRKGTELRNYIKKNGRLKFIPEFAFRIDHGELHRQHIDTLTQEIEKGSQNK